MLRALDVLSKILPYAYELYVERLREASYMYVVSYMYRDTNGE